MEFYASGFKSRPHAWAYLRTRLFGPVRQQVVLLGHGIYNISWSGATNSSGMIHYLYASRYPYTPIAQHLSHNLLTRSASSQHQPTNLYLYNHYYQLPITNIHNIKYVLPHTDPRPTANITPIIDVDADAVLQRSINDQLLAEMEAEWASQHNSQILLSKTKSEMVMQYCLYQADLHRSINHTRMDNLLCDQLSQLALTKRVTWADGWVASVSEASETPTEVEVMMEKQALRYDADFLRRMVPQSLDAV